MNVGCAARAYKARVHTKGMWPPRPMDVQAKHIGGQWPLMSKFFLVSCLSALVPFASFCFLFFYAITILIAIGFESRHNEKLAEMQKTKRAFEEITWEKRAMSSLLDVCKTLPNYYRKFFLFLYFLNFFVPKARREKGKKLKRHWVAFTFPITSLQNIASNRRKRRAASRREEKQKRDLIHFFEFLLYLAFTYFSSESAEISFV